MARSKYADYYNIFKNQTTNDEGKTVTSETFVCRQADCPYKMTKKPGDPTNSLRTHIKNKHPDAFRVLEARDLVAQQQKGTDPKPAKPRAPKTPKDGAKKPASAKKSVDTAKAPTAEPRTPLSLKQETASDDGVPPLTGLAAVMQATELATSPMPQIIAETTTESRKRSVDGYLAQQMIPAEHGSSTPLSSLQLSSFMAAEPLTKSSAFGRFIGDRLRLFASIKRQKLEGDIITLINRADEDNDNESCSIYLSPAKSTVSEHAEVEDEDTAASDQAKDEDTPASGQAKDEATAASDQAKDEVEAANEQVENEDPAVSAPISESAAISCPQ